MSTQDLIVRRLSDRHTRGWITYGPFRWRCALGRSGIMCRKREGDGATPRGAFPLLAVYYRRDKFARLPTCLKLKPTLPGDGWCDAPADGNYNRPVRHPYAASAERMWRNDALYDAVVVIDYNISRRARGLGSAIFMHVAREGYEPTEGCIALAPRDLRLLLSRLRRRTLLRIS